MEVEGVQLGEKYFELKREAFASVCFACHKFGHLASEFPTVIHQPPPNAMPQPAIQPTTKFEASSPRIVNDRNMVSNAKSANQTQSIPIKGKDRGFKCLFLGRISAAKKVVTLNQRLLQSRHWDAFTPSPGQASTSMDSPATKL